MISLSRTTNISLSIIYALFTIGVAISSHYCMGSVRHQDVFSFDNHGCMCEDLMGEEDDCCNDEVAIITIEEDQNIESQFQSISPKLIVLFAFNTDQYFNIELLKTQRSHAKYAEDPPPKNPQPLYLLNCNYTFYG